MPSVQGPDKKGTAYYPAFLQLAGRPCVVIGAGEVAERKAAALLEAGAKVTVVSPEATAEVERLAAAGTVRWERRNYRRGDLAGAWLAIAATDDAAAQQAIFAEAEQARVFCNVVDVTERCSFIAPAVAQKGDLTLAISTGGKSPAVARRLREELQQEVLPGYAALLEIAGEVRDEMKREGVRATPEQWQTALGGEAMALARRGMRLQAKDALLGALRREAAGRTAIVGS
ncbi:MAG: bifunctional precorrin-2 dehydrogenase/sirohydrochlorin ferrochelatase [Dehalococcoidia bacterium]|nr:bifunctional precorrin-2 dehydrogenase/sirohydrochlorin ferrochelatase [Dehalococcoidia bacterium]